MVGTAYLKGGASQGFKGIYSPFEAGAAHMALVGNRLVVHMARLMYEISGVHHQSNLTFEVDTGTMVATTFEQLGDTPYSSHSFQQLVTTNGDALVMVDHGDAYPRAVQLSVMADYPAHRSIATYDLFKFNGAVGDNFTGASVTDLISGPQGVVVLGNSIPQPNAPHGPQGTASDHRNVFALSANPATGTHSGRWLTNFAAHGADNALEPRAVQVGADEFAVLFDVQNGSYHKLEYRLIDSAGHVLASQVFSNAFYASSSAPILVGQTIEWVGIRPGSSSPATAYLYGMDISNPAAPVLLNTAHQRSRTDFNGDGRADIAIYRPTTHQWYVRGSAPITYGADGDQPEPADYTGDGRADIAIYRPTTHQWYVRGSAPITYGADGDQPEPADYTGDGRADIAVYRPTTHQWYVRGSAPITYGADGDQPEPADYTGDGRADIAVYRPTTHQWYVRGSAPITYGADGDQPEPADYTGDGRADIAVYRPTTHQWYVRGSAPITYGADGDQPEPADYTGDGRADIAVYRPTTHQWYVRGSAPITYGADGDQPL